MREIRYQVWDGEHMHQVDTLSFCQGGIRWHGPGVGDGWIGEDGDELREFTGLKDKNGQEIWEGDIVATSNDNPDYDIWTKEEMGYAYVAISPECGVSFQTKTMNWDWDNTDESVYSLQFIEVIGNIYQNPELLEG